jgi:hypothetical protein
LNPSNNNIKEAEKQLNCSIKILSDRETVITAIQIKFKNSRLKNPLTVIEVLEILQLLYICYDPCDFDYAILSTVF